MKKILLAIILLAPFLYPQEELLILKPKGKIQYTTLSFAVRSSELNTLRTLDGDVVRVKRLFTDSYLDLTQNAAQVQAAITAALADNPYVPDSINARLPKWGGTMTGNITFNSTQQIDGIVHSNLKDTTDALRSATQALSDTNDAQTLYGQANRDSINALRLVTNALTDTNAARADTSYLNVINADSIYATSLTVGGSNYEDLMDSVIALYATALTGTKPTGVFSPAEAIYKIADYNWTDDSLSTGTGKDTTRIRWVGLSLNRNLSTTLDSLCLDGDSLDNIDSILLVENQITSNVIIIKLTGTGTASAMKFTGSYTFGSYAIRAVVYTSEGVTYRRIRWYATSQ